LVAPAIGDEAHVGNPGPGRHERQIHHPQLVGGGRGEVATDQVGMSCSDRVRPGGAHPLAAAGALHAADAHQPGNPVAADIVTCPDRGFAQLAGSAYPVVALPDPYQHRDNRGVTFLTYRRLAVADDDSHHRRQRNDLGSV